MQLAFPSGVAHFFKCGGADIASDMTMCTECLKESALEKNGADESALRRRASCS